MQNIHGAHGPVVCVSVGGPEVRHSQWLMGRLPDVTCKVVSRTHVLFFLLIYLFVLAALGFRCTQAFSSCGKRGLLFVAVCGLLTAVASLVSEHGL